VSEQKPDVCEWADQTVRLDGARFRAEATPFLLDLLKGMADAPVKRVSILMPAQVGWTAEAVRARAEEDLRAWLQDGEPA
jgi:hypothetical protein